MNDLKLALRRLKNAPGFTSIATLTLALAIGANAAVFSFADAVLFRPLPYDDADRIFNVGMMNARTGARYTQTPYAYLQLIQEDRRNIAGVGLFERTRSLTVASENGTEAVLTAEVSANYFELLGVRAVRGRAFTSSDGTSGGRPAMLTWTSFQQRFGGDDTVVGKPVTLGEQTLDIVGVLPADFVFPTWTRFDGTTELVTVKTPVPVGAGGATFYPIARLRPGVSVEQAEASMEARATELLPREGDAQVPVLDDARSILYPAGVPVMRFLLAAAGLVLLIGCINLANMLLARTRLREREIGVQAALGASRVGRVRPLLIESLIIGLAGSAAALLATSVVFELLLRQVPPIAVGQAPVGVGPRVVVFTMGLGVLGGLIFAAVPAWQASKLDARALIRGAGAPRGRGSIGRSLLTAEIALAIVLVFGAVIATRAFVAVLQVPLGFDPDNVVTVRLLPSAGGSFPAQDFSVRAIEALEERADVVIAGAVRSMPFDGARADEGVVSPRTGEQMDAGIFHVLPGYFETARIDLVRGRLPSWADVTAGSDVAVVAGSATRSLFGDRDPIGETFASSAGRRFTVIGVVGEVVKTLSGDMEPPVYVIPDETRFMTLVARTRSRSDATLIDIRRQISAMAPGVPITTQWWSDTISNVTAYRNPRFQTIVLGSFGGLALGLTAIGVFGLVAFLVASRMRALGIRSAMGATPGSLTRHSIRHVLAPTIAGVVLGLGVTRGLARLAEAQLYEVNTRDPATLTAAVAAVTFAALIAAYLPARRAARVDPMTVLRME